MARVVNGLAFGAMVAAATAPARRAAADPMSVSPEQAYDLGELPNPRAVAMGGALNAVGVSTAALALNPANMALARVYHLEGTAAYSPQAGRQTYSLAIVDSLLSSTRLAGGLAGAWSQLDPGGLHRTWTDVRAGLAFPFGDHVSVGATLRWLRIEQAIASGPFGLGRPSAGTPDGPLFNELTVDAGATVSFADAFRIAVAGRSLTVPNTALAPTTGVLGLGYYGQTLALEADAQLDFTTWNNPRSRIMGGAELFLAERYAIRAGWRYDAGTKLNSASLGVGYIDPRWSVELGVRHDLVADRAETLGVLSLRYFYDPTGANSANEPGAF